MRVRPFLLGTRKVYLSWRVESVKERPLFVCRQLTVQEWKSNKHFADAGILQLSQYPIGTCNWDATICLRYVFDFNFLG
jgi:hypothetical protein